MKLSKKTPLLVLIIMTLLVPVSVLPEESQNPAPRSEPSMATDLGLGVGSALANVV